MRLTVLGNASRYLAPLSGGSSYLVEHEGTRVLLDCGGGARDALERLGIARLDAVVVSHFHYDHTLDLPTLRDALDERSLLLVPPGERKRLDALATAYAFEGRFDLKARIEEARDPVQVGPLRLSFAPTQHSAPSMATRIGGERRPQPTERGPEQGRSLVYAGDTAPCAPLEDLARGCDTLLMHTLLPTVEPGAEHARIHATAETAAALAARAGARTLLLSHRYHASQDADMLARAPGAVLARTGATYAIPS